jgi:pimeloyl-ACP methyl ester carboxylesterase
MGQIHFEIGSMTRDTQLQNRFFMQVPQQEVDGLRQRLRDTRWPDSQTVDDHSQGVQIDWLQELVAYWESTYDWRVTESRVNQTQQWMVTVAGLDIHVLEARSLRPDAVPLLMTHGWPGSVLDFLDVIEPLVNPPSDQPAFHLVCPSLPGYGFSERPTGVGWNVERIADTWGDLMAILGYSRYAVHGGDWGAHVSMAVAEKFPNDVLAVHLTMPVVGADPDTRDDLTPEEERALNALADHRQWGSGYKNIQGTRPQTIGYALTDSPVGLCAWICEKYWDWMDHAGDPLDVVSADRLLDNVSLHWFTRTAVSSARLYWESEVFRTSRTGSKRSRSLRIYPTAISLFPGEVFVPSYRWCAKRFGDLRYFDVAARGGHFPSIEDPSGFVDQVRRAITAIDIGSDDR